MHFSFRFLWAIIFLTNAVLSMAQKGERNHQLTFISENDSYLSINNDGYYTNGIKISYQWKNQGVDSSRGITKFNDLQAGQLIYNSKEGYYTSISKIDRPVAGYLYASYNQIRYNKRTDMLNWGISVGTIGSASFGRQTQELIHKWMNIYKPKQWEYQLQSGWGLTGSIKWSPKIIKQSKASLFDIKPITGASIGNFFTNAMIGTAVLFGKFNQNSETAFWNNHSGISKKKREYFFYVSPVLFIQAYNATVQGNLFDNKPGVIPAKLNHFFFQNKIGCMYAGNKLVLGFAAVYENKQSLTQKTGEWYGSAQVSYLW